VQLRVRCSSGHEIEQYVARVNGPLPDVTKSPPVQGIPILFFPGAILTCFKPVGELERLAQHQDWKEKQSRPDRSVETLWIHRFISSHIHSHH
jgi:hypothetical protein